MSRFRCKETKVVISNVTTWRFLLIIDQKKIEGEKDGELKACDAKSLSGESCKLSKGIVFFYYLLFLKYTVGNDKQASA